MSEKNWFNKLTYASIFAFCAFCFTSFSLTALHHICLIIPGFYLFGVARRNGEHLRSSEWALVAMIVTCIASALFNLDIIATPHKNIAKVKYFVMALILVPALKHAVKLKFNGTFLLKLFLFSTSLASASGLIGVLTGFNPLRFKAACHLSRACGMYGMYMTYGYGIGLALVLIIGLWAFRKKHKLLNAYWIYIPLVLNSAGFILSKPRGALLGVAIMLPYLLFHKNIKKIIGMYLVSVILFAVSYQTVPGVKEIFERKDRLISIKLRMTQYQASLKAFEERPYFGYGYKNFEPNSQKLKVKYGIDHPQFGGHAHNNFLEHLASTGLIGFLAILAFHFFWFKNALGRRDWIGHVEATFVGAVFISGQFQYTLGDGENLFIILMVFALGRALPSQGKMDESIS